MNAVFNAHPGTILRLHVDRSTQYHGDRLYYLQKFGDAGSTFDVFHAIRLVPLWGSCGDTENGYVINHGRGNYDSDYNTVTPSCARGYTGSYCELVDECAQHTS